MLWKNICHGLLKKYLPGVLLLPADDRMTVSSAIYMGCGQAARDFDGIWLDFGGRIRGDFLLFSCKFFWFVVCVSLPGSFALHWPGRVAGSFALHYSGRAATAGSLRAPAVVRLSPHRPLAKKMLIQASLHRIFFPPVLPGLNARACFQ